jgi:hypothetical protein
MKGRKMKEPNPDDSIIGGPTNEDILLNYCTYEVGRTLAAHMRSLRVLAERKLIIPIVLHALMVTASRKRFDACVAEYGTVEKALVAAREKHGDNITVADVNEELIELSEKGPDTEIGPNMKFGGA